MRRLIPKHGWHITARRLAPAGSPTARKVAAEITALLAGEHDDERTRTAPLPPHGVCQVRRVQGTAVEIWYVAGDDFIALHALKIYGS